MRRFNLRGNGFTLVEVIVVLFIILLLAVVATPAFSQFLKTSRVRQAAEVVYTSMFSARAEAQRCRGYVSIFFGDDLSVLKTQPLPNILPPRGEMEVWRVKGQPGDLIADSYSPWASGYPKGWPPGYWYPFNVKQQLLTPNPISLPEGVRVIAGKYSRYWDSVKLEEVSRFYFPAYQKSPMGELKRHSVTFTRAGRTAGFGFQYNYPYVLVFDMATGEHLIITSGSWYSNARPRILPYSLTHIGIDQIKSHTEIESLINNIPGDS